eukprot:411111_1
MGAQQSHENKAWIRFSVKELSHHVPYSESELLRIHKIFRDASARHSGAPRLNKAEFARSLKKLGLHAHNAHIVENLFVLFDQDHSGTVDFREFVSGLVILLNGEDEEMVKLLFGCMIVTTADISKKQRLNAF